MCIYIYIYIYMHIYIYIYIYNSIDRRFDARERVEIQRCFLKPKGFPECMVGELLVEPPYKVRN